MPCVTSLDALHGAVSEFVVTDLDLVIEPPALAAARRSLDSSGLLLLGEVHGVRENPLLIRALMKRSCHSDCSDGRRWSACRVVRHPAQDDAEVVSVRGQQYVVCI